MRAISLVVIFFLVFVAGESFRSIVNKKHSTHHAHLSSRKVNRPGNNEACGEGGICRPRRFCPIRGPDGYWDGLCDGIYYCCKPAGAGGNAPADEAAASDALSGSAWVTWANTNAPGSKVLSTLSDTFRPMVTDFIAALKAGGADVEEPYTATYRPPMRAYLFRWSWLINICGTDSSASDSCSAFTSVAAVPCFDDTVPAAQTACAVDPKIQWGHGTDAASIAGAGEMVSGFSLATPTSTHPSYVAPAHPSRHEIHAAIDMKISWDGTLTFKKKNGDDIEIEWLGSQNGTPKLHELGLSYGVHKLDEDEQHWSDTGG